MTENRAETTADRRRDEINTLPEQRRAGGKRLAAGREVWEDRRRHCHGKSAYPGKVPKLRPRRYKPEFV